MTDRSCRSHFDGNDGAHWWAAATLQSVTSQYYPNGDEQVYWGFPLDRRRTVDRHPPDDRAAPNATCAGGSSRGTVKI